MEGWKGEGWIIRFFRIRQIVKRHLLVLGIAKLTLIVRFPYRTYQHGGLSLLFLRFTIYITYRSLITCRSLKSQCHQTILR